MDADRVNTYTKTCRFSALFFSCQLFSPEIVWSRENTSLPRVPIESGNLLDISGGLVAVVFAILLLGAMYAKFQGMGRGSNGIINVIATQAIGPKEKIAIVEVAKKQLLIGMTSTSVQTLHVFDEPAAIVPEPKTPFAERLKITMRGALK